MPALTSRSCKGSVLSVSERVLCEEEQHHHALDIDILFMLWLICTKTKVCADIKKLNSVSPVGEPGVREHVAKWFCVRMNYIHNTPEVDSLLMQFADRWIKR